MGGLRLKLDKRIPTPSLHLLTPTLVHSRENQEGNQVCNAYLFTLNTLGLHAFTLTKLMRCGEGFDFSRQSWLILPLKIRHMLSKPSDLKKAKNARQAKYLKRVKRRNLNRQRKKVLKKEK